MPGKNSRQPLQVDGDSLTLESFERVARPDPATRVVLSRRAISRMERACSVIRRVVHDGLVVYGVTTGFGRLAEINISPSQRRSLQRNLILSHATGVGPLCTRSEVRGMMLLRLNLLANGHSGTRVAIARRLAVFLNSDLCPVVPRRGSVGASGDLAPMAHIALAVIGEGEVFLSGRRQNAGRALSSLKLSPINLEAKEGLALINGVQASTALLALSLCNIRRLMEVADLTCALTAVAINARKEAFDPRLAAVRGHAGHMQSSRRILQYLRSSGRRRDPKRVQDPYSIRCAPQVHGACRDTVAVAVLTCETEMNAVTDNPIVFPDSGDIVTGGNFHGAPIGHTADQLAASIADVAAISERRIAVLMDPALTDATSFLGPANGEGLHSGLMMWQVTAAALVSEMKTLAHPASVDSIPTSLGQEDHVSMSMWAADKLGQVVERWRTVVAIEALAAWRAVALADRIPQGGLLRSVTDRLRELNRPSFADALLGSTIQTIESEIEDWGITPRS